MNTELKLFFVRHGQTLLNEADRVQGWVDSPLTEEGIEVVESLGRGLKDVPFLDVYTSTSGRTIETAELILKENNYDAPSLKPLKSLREWYFGGFEAEMNQILGEAIMLRAKIKSQEELTDLGLPKVAQYIYEEDVTKKAEHWISIEKRLKESLDIIITNNRGKKGNILIVSHGMTIASILYIINPSWKASELLNASISTVTYKNDNFTILNSNNMDYVYKGGYLKPFDLAY